MDSEGEPDVDVETNKSQEDEECLSVTTEGSRSSPSLNMAQGVSSNDPESRSVPEATLVDPQRINLHLAQSSEREIQDKARPERAAASFVDVS